MENSEKNLGRWVDGRMALLMESGEYRLDVEQALGRLWTWGEAPASRQTDGHLDRLLAPQVEVPWFVGLWQSLRERLHPEKLPPLNVTSRPVAVKDIWGLYPTRRKSMLYSLALQGAVVALTFVTVTSPVVQDKVRNAVSLVAPVLRPLDMKPQKNALQGGGGGGDRSPMPAAKGKLPKVAMRQFVPPTEVVLNEHPKLTMEPTIVAPPDTILPNANLPNVGDPLAKLGPPSNGMGSGGGIGNGIGGGIGSGTGAGLGPGNGGGFGGGVFRAGGGVSAPTVLSRVEPEYSEEARKAKYSGTVLLQLIVDVDGRPKSIHVSKGVGLGLDEKAIEAVQKWKFVPGKKNGQAVPVFAMVEVNFRLL
jgi:TonB family protein